MLDNFKAPLSLLGRVLLALMFVMAGFSKLGSVAGTAGYIANHGLPFAQALAIGTGAFELLAGGMLLVGWQARWAALVLAGFTVLASLIFHAFWSVPAEVQRVQELLFTKNFAIAGGLLMVAALGAGPLSVDERLSARRLAAA